MTSRVVVTGVGMVTPVGLDTPSSWAALISGKSGIDYIASFDTEGFDTTIAAEIKGFDPITYLDRKAARHIDRFAQLAIAASLEALEQSCLKIDGNNHEDVAVMIGSGIGGILTLSEQLGVLYERGPSRVNPFLVPMMLSDMASGQVSMLLGIKGPSICTVSSCCSGADAIGEAFELIRRGDAEVAITGGAEAAICPIGIAGFNSCRALSTQNDDPRKASRPFDAKRDGFVLGEGAGVLIMESLDHATDRGASPLAEMTGYGATSDAYHVTQPAPRGEGAARAMNMALRKAGVRPEEIDYINAHGTSTPFNDKFETMALKTVFDEEAYKVPISSTKSMIGHLLGAAGAVEAAVCVMAIQTGSIPPTINLENPDPDCDLDYTPRMARRDKVRTAMSNSLGFGGHNTSLIFQAYES